MGYASQAGRARTSATNPQAHAICDRCGCRYNHVNLRWQYDWRGASMQNIRLLVCNTCYDVPQEQLRAIVVPADPVPIVNPRVQDFVTAEQNTRTTSGSNTVDPTTGIPVPGGATRITQDDKTRSTQVIGPPNGLEQDAVMPLFDGTSYAVIVPASSVLANGTTIITVICSTSHNLTSDSQISVEGLTDPSACGFYNVNILSSNVFTYEIMQPLNSGSLITSTTRIATALVGVPYGF